MSFPQYPKYKESGVEWLGKVPEQWAIKRLQLVASFESGMAHEPYIDDSGEFICVNSRFVSTGGETKKLCTKNLSPAKKNDVLIVMSDLPKGRALAKAFFVLDDTPYAVNQRVGIITPKATHSRFLFYYLDRNPGFLLHDDGLNQTHLWNDLFKKFPTPFPPLSEQIAIASFLDRETAKIDALVAEQKRLIELLKEKRQAVISHAVTKGLNPNAKMKPSGIEWLGDVPEHWEVGRLSYLTELIVDGTHHSPLSLPSGDYLYITAKNIKESGFDLSDITYITHDEHLKIYPRCPVKFGDVLYIKDGATAGVAMVNTIKVEFSLLSSVALIRPNKKILLPEFVTFQLNSNQFKKPALNSLVGGAMTRFTLDMISRFLVGIPPIEEQKAIGICLGKVTESFEKLTAEAQRAIDLLQERRSALISAAVTGQIDVRGLVPSEAA